MMVIYLDAMLSILKVSTSVETLIKIIASLNAMNLPAYASTAMSLSTRKVKLRRHCRERIDIVYHLRR